MYTSRTLGLQALIVVALIVLLEGAARVAYTVRSDLRQSNWFTYAADVGWDRRPNFDGLDICGVRRRFDHRGLVLEDAARLGSKPEDGFRALFLGDSSVYGYCLDTAKTFVEVANRLYPQAQSINLGVNGYSSYQGYKALLKYGDSLNPGIIFVSFNFNDRRMVLRDDEADSDNALQRISASQFAQQLRAWSYAFRFAENASRRLDSGNIGSAGEVAQIRLDKVRPRVDARGYRENLTRMVRWAKQRGIPVVFILLGDNPIETFQLREGIGYLDQGNYEQAIKHLTFVKGHPRTWFAALASIHLSKAYAGAGDTENAEREMSFANPLVSLHGGYPIVLDTEYNKIMREVAAEHGVTLIDAAALLAKSPDVFFDFCHFDAKGHEIIAERVADVLAKAKSRNVTSTR